MIAKRCLLLIVVVLTACAAPAPAPSVRYVALGDSYTSAPGTGRQAGGPPGCDRTEVNYPHRVAAALRPAEFADVSCGGATTEHLTSPQRTRDGVNPPQLDAVTAATTLVTLGIGGNDVGFMAFLPACGGSPCRDRLGGQVAARIAATAPKVAAALDAIHAKAPRAKVIVVGYPAVLPESGGCAAVPLDAGDVAYFRAALGQLNAMLRDQASAHGAEFADTAAPGHDVCAAPGQRWVEGLRPESPAAPLHPNALGEQGMADAVLVRARLLTGLQSR